MRARTEGLRDFARVCLDQCLSTAAGCRDAGGPHGPHMAITHAVLEFLPQARRSTGCCIPRCKTIPTTNSPAIAAARRGVHRSFGIKGGRAAGKEIHRRLADDQPSGQCRRCQDAGHSSSQPQRINRWTPPSSRQPESAKNWCGCRSASNPPRHHRCLGQAFVFRRRFERCSYP